MRSVRAAAVTAAVATLSVLVPGSARASLHDCDIQATNTAKISSARDMSCERAAREMRDYKGQISPRFTTPAKFTCARVSGGRFGGQWRCVHDHKAFRFEFRD
jgi:hypothetical protein